MEDRREESFGSEQDLCREKIKWNVSLAKIRQTVRFTKKHVKSKLDCLIMMMPRLLREMKTRNQSSNSSEKILEKRKIY